MHEKKDEIETIKINSRTSVTTLYYSGIIKPIQTMNVANTKAEGIITYIGFEYGQRVKKNQLLFIIKSKQLAKDYQSALSDYIKAKKNFADVQFQMEGAEALKKLKIISLQEYLNTKTQMFNAELDTAQAERRLDEMLQDSGVSKQDIDKLDVSDPKSIQIALSVAPEIINIFSPTDGTALLPASGSSGSGGGGSTKLIVGSPAKQGQELVSVVNESGVLVTIKVTELEVNKLQLNQKALITGDAFPGITLEGKVAHIDRIASADNSGGIPSFAVDIVYPKLSAKEDEIIRVGMSVEISIPFTVHQVVKIPLTAVYKDKDRTLVKKLDKKTGKITPVVVETGKADITSIEIIKGLEDGDEVVVDAATH